MGRESATMQNKILQLQNKQKNDLIIKKILKDIR